MLLRLSLVIGLTVTATAVAQAPFIPPDSLVVVQLDGPARFRADFAETNLARMLASAKVRSVTGLLQGAIEMGVRQVERETDADVEGLVDGLLGYTGRMTLAFNLLTDDPDFNDPPPVGGVLVLDGDGQTDLPALAKTIAMLIEQHAGVWLKDLDVGGQTMKMIGEHGAGMTVPQIIDGRLVTFFGMPLAETVALYQAHREAQGAARDGNFVMHVNGTRLMKLVRTGIVNADDDEEDADMILDMIDVFGVGNLAAIDVRIAPEAKRIVADASLTFDGAIRGYFDFFVPDAPGRPAVLARTPTDRDMWSVQTTRFDKVLPFVKELFTVMGAEAPTTYAEMQAAFGERFGLDLEADLGKHLDDRMIIVGDAAMMPPLMADDAPDHLCVAFAVKDGPAMRRTLLTMLEKSGMTPATTAHGDVDVYQIVAPDAQLEWAIVDNLAMLSMGPGGSALLRKLIDGRETELPAAIAQRLTIAPDGWDSASSIRIRPFVESLLAAAKQQGGLPDAAERYAQMFIGVLGDFDLEYFVTGSRSGAGQIVHRTIW